MISELAAPFQAMIPPLSRWGLTRAFLLGLLAIVGPLYPVTASAAAEVPPASTSPSAETAPNLPPTGRIRTRHAWFALTLVAAAPASGSAAGGDDGLRMLESKDGILELPAGSYHLLQWRAEGIDRAGRRWRLKGNGWPEPITVTAGQTTEIPLAAPIRPYLQVVQAANRLNFHLEYGGSQGERCTELRAGGGMPPIPWVRFVNAKNQTVARVRFEAKCGGTCLMFWKPSKTLSGRFRALVEADLGPFPLEGGPGMEFELKAGQMVQTAPRIGDTAPDFTLITKAGHMHRLSFKRPRPVLLCFFCRCPLCHEVATKIARTSDLSRAAQVVVVASDPEVTESDDFRRETGLEGIYLCDSPPVIALQYRSEACPRVWLIDGAGRLRFGTSSNLTPPDRVIAGLLTSLRRIGPDRPKAPAADRPKGPQRRPAPRTALRGREIELRR